jgi:hypothetical protein
MPYKILSSSEIQSDTLPFWQTPIWSDILLSSHQAREVFYFWNPNGSYILIEIRSIGLGFFGAFSLWVTDQQIGADWSIFIQNLCDFLSKKWVLYLQIEPITDLHLEKQSGYKKPNTLGHRPYRKFLTPHTRIIDLSGSEDDILAQMHEKWRYSIRTATKRWVAIESVEPTSENIDIWMNLLTETLSRDKFAGNSEQYYVSFLQNLADNDIGWLYFAKLEGRVIAAWVFVYTKERAIYYYGASSSLESDRKVLAPYLLQWEAILIAKRRGILQYDLLWVSDPDHPDDELAGVSFFKSRFGGVITPLPPKILYLLSWKYTIFRHIQKIKNLLKKRRRH